MEPEVRFAKIEALLHAMAERENQMEIRFNQRMDSAERRAPGNHAVHHIFLPFIGHLYRLQPGVTIELLVSMRSQA